MNVHVSYKAGKTPEIEREVQHQIHKLGRRLGVFKPDLIHLHAHVAQENSRNARSSVNLRLPTGQMAAERSGENGVAAVKAAFADLLSQVTKHKELLRGHWSRTRQPDSGIETSTAVPRPSRASSRTAKPAPAIAQSGAEKWINANLPRLKDFVEMELQLCVGTGQIREGQISCEEVVDEVMVSALSQDESRTVLLSSDGWFHRLAVQAIRRLIKSNADTGNLSLDASAGTQNVTGSDEKYLQYHQPDESLPEESVIGDTAVRTPEEIFLSEEMVAQLGIILNAVNTQDREAFVLYTLEGFTVDEISRLSDRSPDQVRKSIQHARDWVRQKLPEHNQFRRSLLHRSHVA